MLNPRRSQLLYPFKQQHKHAQKGHDSCRKTHTLTVEKSTDDTNSRGQTRDNIDKHMFTEHNGKTFRTNIKEKFATYKRRVKMYKNMRKQQMVATDKRVST